MSNEIKIIDLFAGPGGLGEGFSALRNKKGKPVFRIGVSIEKEASAHQTLRLRAFYRQFPNGKAPKEYYDFMEGKLGKRPDDKLFKLKKFEHEVEEANREARMLALGPDNEEIDKAIKAALGNQKSKWVLIGGPPCQAYSLAGRSRNKGKKGYRIEDDDRSSLYKEYLRIIQKFKPAVFVMENVKGMLSAKKHGDSIFAQILMDLSNPNQAVGKRQAKQSGNLYEIHSLVVPRKDGEDLKPGDFLIKSENHGIPQTRHRVIILGIRKGIKLKKKHPKTLTEEKGPSLQQIIGDLPKLRSGVTKTKDNRKNWASAIAKRGKKISSVVRTSGMEEVADKMQEAIKDIKETKLGRKPTGSETTTKGPRKLAHWYKDPANWQFVSNHESRGHMPADLERYLFCSSYGQVKKKQEKRTPSSDEFPKILAPNHKNWKSGKFADRFRVQAADIIATTVTSHISKDGHYFIHYDPSQCRSLTVREAARIQTFPDNYFFVGNRTQQYVQVGNAVPPYLASQIAAIVHKLLT